MGQNPESRQAPTLLVLAAFAMIYVVWGSTYLAIRFAIETLPPFFMTGLRFLAAGVLLFAGARLRDRSPITWRNWLAAARVGILMFVGGVGLVTWSVQWVASGLAALLVATVPLWIVLLDWAVFRGARPTGAVMISLVIGLAGVYILIGPAALSGEPIDPVGAGTVLLACLFWSLGSLHSRKASLPSSAFLSASMELIVAGIAFFLITWSTGEWHRVDPAVVSMKSVMALLYLTLFGSILTVTSYVWLLRVVSASKVATYAYVNPVVAILLGATLAGEPVSARVVFSAAMIIAAVALITLGRSRPTPAPRPADRALAPGEPGPQVEAYSSAPMKCKET